MAYNVTIYNDSDFAKVDNARVHTWMVLTDGQGNSTYYSYGPGLTGGLFDSEVPGRWATAVDSDFADSHSTARVTASITETISQGQYDAMVNKGRELTAA